MNAAIHVIGPMAVAIGGSSEGALNGSLARPGVPTFVMTMILVYLSSAIYHICPASRMKDRFRTVDCCAIYLFIAGSCTPFAMGVLRDHGGGALLVLIWFLACIGMIMCVSGLLWHPSLSIASYVVMAMIASTVAWPLVYLLPSVGLIWMLAGMAFYSGGIVFFLLDRHYKFAHSIWHLLVIAGSTSHFIVATQYA
ncbi:UNVERIFIED_ORG: hemolysin III [Burkholderia contaminans]|nr:hemolysin III [Burkholderia contaminans]